MKLSLLIGRSAAIAACLFVATQASAHPLEQAEPNEWALQKELSIMFGRSAAQSKLRGTHSKGVCMSGKFEVLSDSEMSGVPRDVLRKLRTGLFEHPTSVPYNARIRFANAAGRIAADKDYDARALSFALDLKDKGRHDFVVQNSPIFPIPSLADFVLLLQFVHGGSDITKFPPDQQRRIGAMVQFGKTFSPDVKSYRTEKYWSGVAFALGNDAVKYVMEKCSVNKAGEPDKSNPNYLEDDLKAYASSGGSEADCFDFYIQPRTDGMGPEWIENPTLAWDENKVPKYKIAKLHLDKNSIVEGEKCDAPENRFSVVEHSLPTHKALGRINRGRTLPETASAIGRSQGAEVVMKWIEETFKNPPPGGN